MEAWLENFARASFCRSADTAHDLKTPLNIAVLNLELLRMRLQKLPGVTDDEKITTYTRAIETELRRMGWIFDSFFLLSSPPLSEGAPVPVDVGRLAAEAAEAAGLELDAQPVALAPVHESRIRQALELFMGGASRLLSGGKHELTVESDDGTFVLVLAGRALPGVELQKVFKFYYNDPDGNPDLSLAIARLVAETYGGGLTVQEDRDKVFVRLSFPLGAE